MQKLTLKQLEGMEKLGIEMFGEMFKDTLTYVQIQRMKKELI
jgi:hypothetical protein